jgi:hypothetical protein
MFNDNYGSMSKEGLKEVSDELFVKFDSQGRRMQWLADQLGVSRQTAYLWRHNGAPIYAIRVMKMLLAEKYDLKEMLSQITDDNKHEPEPFNKKS